MRSLLRAPKRTSGSDNSSHQGDRQNYPASVAVEEALEQNGAMEITFRLRTN